MFEIRTATREDLAEIIALFMRIEPKDFTREELASWLDRSWDSLWTQLAGNGEQLVGATCCHIMTERTFEDAVQIDYTFVAPGAAGVTDAFLRGVEAWALLRGKRRIITGTRRDHEAFKRRFPQFTVHTVYFQKEVRQCPQYSQ